MAVFEGMVGVLVWAVRRVGYWLRPYDMLADARRWVWQPRTRCGWDGLLVLRDEDTVRVFVSPAEQITDRDRAVALGLGAAWDALERALREARSDGSGPA